MATPEGYATPEGGLYRYVYQYKDHLGNTRLSYTKNDAGTLEIIEESNYYPFGLQHKGYNSAVSSLGNSTAQLLKFGGKEEQNELGLEWLDFGARNYNPAVGRWFNVDNMSEDYAEWSPYNYTLNNPIYFIDPDGNAVNDLWSFNTDTNQLEWVDDTGGADVQIVQVTNNEGDDLGSGAVAGSEVHVAQLENSVFISSYDATSDIPDGYNSNSGYSYTGLDLKKRHQLKELGGVLWGQVREAETNGDAIPVHSKTAYDAYVNKWGTNSAFWFGAEHYFMPEGGARGVAQRGYNALRKQGRSLDNTLAASKSSTRNALRNSSKTAYRSISGKTTSNSGSISKSASGGSSQTSASRVKNSWNAFLSANKGKYSGQNWVKKASQDYRALKSSTQQ
ncbi:RHS repeat-associated core domain-containing protein [Aquimarina celericrescens]|nr:RHS repeat-associated core domain-containing protein [Aquimarina celericrescens]